MIATRNKIRKQDILKRLPDNSVDTLLDGSLSKKEFHPGEYLRFDNHLVQCLEESDYVAQRDSTKKYCRCSECFFGQLQLTQTSSYCFGPRCEFYNEPNKKPLIYIDIL